MIFSLPSYMSAVTRVECMPGHTPFAPLVAPRHGPSALALTDPSRAFVSLRLSLQPSYERTHSTLRLVLDNLSLWLVPISKARLLRGPHSHTAQQRSVNINTRQAIQIPAQTHCLAHTLRLAVDAQVFATSLAATPSCASSISSVCSTGSCESEPFSIFCEPY
ncbi:hypothetical protein CBOM_07899 [Ceraceosorus bombacis]|uniref:Uncharacterized protein n=1 Tax=Ceraceosorus bombacis TaxID=401625 RepID=A0A0P1BRN5_9BASI|nr:hypothetical protein CBOM_07899 [Ceraceosorus bombacis]